MTLLEFFTRNKILLGEFFLMDLVIALVYFAFFPSVYAFAALFFVLMVIDFTWLIFLKRDGM